MKEEKKLPPLELVRQGNVAFYGYEEELPDYVLDKKTGEITVFVKKGKDVWPNKKINVRRYNSLLDIVQEDVDVCFLDRQAIKMLVTRFPQRARYLFVRLTFHSSWLFGFFGLLRRILKGHVKIRSISRFKSGRQTSFWLILEKQKLPVRINFSVSTKIGVQGLIDYFKERRIRYVVLRFYQKLPQLYRQGGDLDILVADEDEEKVVEFLRSHEGTINVDLYTVGSRKAGGVPYYPPPLARKILESAIDGSAGARIPAPKEALLSFAYHVVYHKGSRAGIPSRIQNVHVIEHPQNDYMGILGKMVQNLNITVELTLEGLDEYLNKEGWRPPLDTLAKIAQHNEWVLKRFFSVPGAERGVAFGVFVLKERAMQRGIVEKLLSVIEAEGFIVVYKERLEGVKKRRAAEHLRGGNWASRSGNAEDFLPSLVLVVVDLGVRSPQTDLDILERIRLLKRKLRKTFDNDPDESIVHSTDTIGEALEYLKVCFPEEIDVIGEKINAVAASRLPFFKRITLSIRTLPYLVGLKIRRFLLQRILQ